MPCCHWVRRQQQSLDYTNNRLVLCKTPITAPISKNSFILPGNVASSALAFLRTMTERKDRRLMLHVLKSVVQFREKEVRKALEFMPGSVPPTFTHNNRLFQSPKSVLLRCFKSPKLHHSTITRQLLLQVLQHQLLQASQHLHQLLHNS